MCYLGETADNDSDAMDHASEDSNRESHEGNAYPDEPDYVSDDDEERELRKNRNKSFNSSDSEETKKRVRKSKK